MPTVNTATRPSASNGDVGNGLFEEVKIAEDPVMIRETSAIAIPSDREDRETEMISEYTPDIYTSPLHDITPLGKEDVQEEEEEDVLGDEEEEMLIPSRPSSASPTRMRPPSTRQVEEVKEEAVEDRTSKAQLRLKKKHKRQQAAMSFKELTAEFDRILKPFQTMFAVQTVRPGQDMYDTSGDCFHPLLAVEPSNPATPPRSFKIHKQRTVIRPGYTFVEPVLLDLPVNPLTLSQKGIENILHMTHNMKNIPPRFDNFTHHPPSDLLFRPSCYVPAKKHLRPIPREEKVFSAKCVHSSAKMFL